jgi:hypothetical protein
VDAKLDPIGESRDELRFAQLRADLMNGNPYRKSKRRVRPAELMNDFAGERKARKSGRLEKPQDMRDFLLAYTRLRDGVVAGETKEGA